MIGWIVVWRIKVSIDNVVKEVVEPLRGKCEYDGELFYRRVFHKDEFKLNEGYKAFCLLGDEGCPFYASEKHKDYCMR